MSALTRRKREIMGYFSSNKRPLTDDEIAAAKKVYRNTIRYEAVLIADDTGAQDRRWTEPVGPGIFVLHMGEKAYASTANPYLRKKLIHELCHVWQGTNH